MLIIPFIENAFKHGVAKSVDKSWIKVSLRENEHWMNIAISNSKGQNSTKGKNGGIGLKNVKKRLDILYLDNYNLDITETFNSYEVFLSIPINQGTEND